MPLRPSLHYCCNDWELHALGFGACTSGRGAYILGFAGHREVIHLTYCPCPCASLCSHSYRYVILSIFWLQCLPGAALLARVLVQLQLWCLPGTAHFCNTHTWLCTRDDALFEVLGGSQKAELLDCVVHGDSAGLSPIVLARQALLAACPTPPCITSLFII